MENNNQNVNEQAQSGQGSSNSEIDSQRVNDERFSHLQSEMAMLKAMMEKLLEQNEERNRQTDTNAATSSFAVRSSNNNTFSIRLYYYNVFNRLNGPPFKSFCNKIDVLLSH